MLKQSVRLLALCAMLCLTNIAIADDLDDNVIRLSTTGEVKVAPNMATITVAVTTQSKTADSAVKDNAKSMEKAVKSLQSTLAKNDTLQTSQYQLMPVVQHDRDANESKIIGYRVSNQITIEYHNLATLGNLLDAAVSQGINQIDALRFSHTDSAALQKKALEQAIAQSKVTADVIAKAAGVTIKGVKEIASYDNNPTPVFREMAMSMDARGAAPQVMPGEITLSATVNVVYSIH